MRIASRLTFARLTAVLGTLALTTTGFAQETQATFSYPECTSKPTEGDTAAAKGAFQAGTAAYNEADYAKAITYWEDAFHRDCTATALLLNLARAYESSTQYDRAIVALRTYNERNADSPQRDQIERRIERLEEQLKAASDKPVPVVAPTATPAAQPARQEPAAPSSPPEDANTKPSVIPLIVAIAGGGIALVGGAGYLKAKSDADKITEQCGGDPGSCNDPVTQEPRQDLIDKGNEARKQQVASGWFAGAGVVIGVGGAVWYLFEIKRANNAAKKAEQSWHLVPQVGPSFAGVSFDGRF